MRIYDSFALLKLFQKEQGHLKVAKLLEDDRKSENLPLIQIINFGEVIYITKKEFGEHAKLRVIRSVLQMGFKIISAADNWSMKRQRSKEATRCRTQTPSSWLQRYRKTP